MNTWIERYVAFLFRFRWVALLVMLALTAGGLYGAKNLTFKGDYRIFFSEDNPQLAAHDALERTYTKADSVIFVVQPDEDTIYQRDVLEAVEWIAEEAWQLPLAIRVDSITNFQHLFVSGDDIEVRDLAENPKDLSDKQLAYVEEVAQSEPFIAGKAVALDERTTAVQATFQLPDNPARIANEIANTARDIRERALEKFPGLTIKVTGTVMLNNAFSEVAIADMTTLYPLMLAFLALTMFWFLRSAWGSLTAMIVVLLSATVAYGVAGWLGFYISSPSTSAFVIILTVAVADSIHVMVTMFKQMREGADKRKAISESLRINMQPVFLTSLTTAIGFFSLNFSDAPPIKDLGNISAFGAIAAFFYSIVLLPILLDLLPMKAHATGGRDKKLLSAVVEFVIRRKIAIVSAFVILLVVVGLAMPRLYINDKFVEFFSRDMDFRTATDFSMENLTGIYVVEFSLGAGEAGGIADPGYLQRVDEFVTWIESYPVMEETGEGIDHVNAFTYVMKRLNRAMHQDDPEYYRLPEDRVLAAQYLLLYEMSLPEGQDLNNQINVDKSATRVTVTMGDVASGYIRQFAQDAEAWLRENQPDYMFSRASGVSLMFSFLTERNVLAMINGTAIAFLLISATLMIALRSLRMGMISLLPNFLPAIIVFGIWSMTYQRIGLYAAFVTATALGLIVDFTVHFLSKYLRARREFGHGAEDGVRYAMNTVGSALWVSAFVLIVGFSALTASDFQINSLMGLLTAMIIAVALVTDFLFLPALLVLLDRGKRGEPSDVVNESAPATSS